MEYCGCVRHPRVRASEIVFIYVPCLHKAKAYDECDEHMYTPIEIEQ